MNNIRDKGYVPIKVSRIEKSSAKELSRSKFAMLGHLKIEDLKNEVKKVNNIDDDIVLVKDGKQLDTEKHITTIDGGETVVEVHYALANEKSWSDWVSWWK